MSDPDAVVSALRRCDFFKDFDDQVLDAIISIGAPSHFKNGQVVLREGELDKNCCIVVKGEVQVSKRGHDGADVPLVRLRQGDFVGLGALLSDKPHNATVSAAGDDTVLLQLSSDGLLEFVSQNPLVAKALLRYFAEELRLFRSKLVDVVGNVPDEEENTIVFFDAKQYEKDVFDRHLQDAKEALVHFKYVDAKLNKNSVALAAGAKVRLIRGRGFLFVVVFLARLVRNGADVYDVMSLQAVCIFVNDVCDADVLVELSGLGVEMVLLRCAGELTIFRLLPMTRVQVQQRRPERGRRPRYHGRHGATVQPVRCCGARGRALVVGASAFQNSPRANEELLQFRFERLSRFARPLFFFQMNRRIPRACNRVMTGNFTLDGLVGFDLHGKTVGVIGTGKVCALISFRIPSGALPVSNGPVLSANIFFPFQIGQCFINIVVGFGCKVLCHDPYPVKDLEKLPGVKYADLDTVLRSCDVFSLHAPLTPETKHIINNETIAKMPKGAM
ncbi:MAG: hypothetical protein BJ554DRAFT_8474, partial [Olpidium bornovanus]